MLQQRGTITPRAPITSRPRKSTTVRSILLIAAELGLLAAAQFAGGTPWTVVAAVALVLQAAAGLTPLGLARLALAFAWLGLTQLTENRELFFCFSMTLAVHLAVLCDSRRWRLGSAAGGLIVAVFLGFRIAQQATLKVLAVEAAVAAVILVVSLLAHQLITRQLQCQGPVTTSAEPRARCVLATTAIVLIASIAAYAGLAL